MVVAWSVVEFAPGRRRSAQTATRARRLIRRDKLVPAEMEMRELRSGMTDFVVTGAHFGPASRRTDLGKMIS